MLVHISQQSIFVEIKDQCFLVSYQLMAELLDNIICLSRKHEGQTELRWHAQAEKVRFRFSECKNSDYFKTKIILVRCEVLQYLFYWRFEDMKQRGRKG